MSDEKGTNQELLGKSTKYTKPSGEKGGRPKYDRDLIIRNLALRDASGRPRYTNAQVAHIVGCSTKTIKRVKKKAIKDGSLKPMTETGRAIGIVEGDFEAECERAQGSSFLGWLNTRFSNKSSAKGVFNFCSKVWEQVWNKPSLVDLKDKNSQSMEKCAIMFHEKFGSDKKRMRQRLKRIRFLMRFIDRRDINDKHFKMSNSKHPRAVRRIDEVTFMDFPTKLDECFEEFENRLGWLERLGLQFKLCTQMRTGSKKSEREFYGLRKGSQSGKSYIIFNNRDEFRSTIYAKKSEIWRLIWLPEQVRHEMYEHTETLDTGDFVFDFDKRKVSRTWGNITKKKIGVRMRLHDLRKVSITWFYSVGIPLEVSAMMNVGWRDLSTAMKHYADIKPILRSSTRAEYSGNIPEWFTEGLNEFTGHDALIPASDATGAFGSGSGFGGRR